MDESIVRFMKKKHNVLIGERTAEQIKMQIGIVSPEPPVGTMDVTGRNLVSGLPTTVHITTEEISAAVEEPATQILEAIHSVLERTPPELASDIFERGITLTGGGALLSGLSVASAAPPRSPAGWRSGPSSAWPWAPARPWRTWKPTAS